MVITATSKFNKGDFVKLTRRPDLGTFTVVSVMVYATNEGEGKLAYNLRQVLFSSGAFGFEESFTLRGIEESELEAVEHKEEVTDGPTLQQFNLD